ncbi:MAG: T9SS type A sorting domain-containing protein, partial [Winogradskyella sp.]
YVQADCTGGDLSSWVGPFAFTTLCTPYTATYTQNFDAESTPDINTCWGTILENPTSSYANINSSTTQSVSASNSVRFYNSSDDTSDFYLVSPNFSDLDNTKRIVFQLYQNQGTSDEGDVVEVGTMTDPSDASTYTTFKTITYAERTEDSWSNIVVNFDTYAGSDNFVAIKINFGATYNYYYLDNFVYEAIPSCVEPSALMATNITATTADLGWTLGGSEALWNVEVVTAGTTATGTATDTGVANGFTKMSLTPSTDYEFYVQADCTGGDLSPWAGPFAFSTPCAAESAAYTADMSANVPDACWNEAGSGEVAAGPSGLGASSWKAGRAFTDADGNVVNSNVMNLYQGNVAREWLISPVFDLDAIGASGLLVKVAVTDYSGSGTSAATATDTMGSDDEVQLVMTTDNGTTWTNVTTWNVGNQPDVTGTDYILDLSGMTGSVQFAFFASDGTVDDSEDYDFHVGTFEVSNAVLSTVSFDNEAAFTYYPNPVKNTLTLNAQNTIDNVTMYNMLGQVVLNAKPNNVDSELDMSNLKSGAYFVKVTIANNTKTIKVIKQ